MKRIMFIVCTVLAISAMQVHAEGKNHGAAIYLSQDIGARAAGMGGAFVALADDITAGYWNPAALTLSDLYDYQIGSQYVFLPNDMAASYLSFANQVSNKGVFAYSWINHGVGEIEKRDALGNELGTFTDSENALLVSYGRKMYEQVKGLSLGATVKVLHHALDDETAIGHGLDIGALWQPFYQWDHTVGINIQNLLQQLYWKNSTDASMINVKIGAAMKFLRSNEALYHNRLIATLDLEAAENGWMNYHVGAEYWPIKIAAIRAGVNQGAWTAGLAFKYSNIEIDYAFCYELSALAAHQHRVSVIMRLE